MPTIILSALGLMTPEIAAVLAAVAGARAIIYAWHLIRAAFAK